MATASFRFVCPVCKTALAQSADAYACGRCQRRYPIIVGIPDFRLQTDPFITIDDDRAKAAHLFEEGRGRTFEDLVRYYYRITPEDPPDLAERWTRHHLAEVPIADAQLDAAGFRGPGTLVDLGCSTGALLIAATRRGWQASGVDVALRWLVVARKRLEESGVEATLVCANALQLPFPEETFDAVIATDLLEHVGDPRTVLQEARRTTKPGGRGLFTANNRYAPLLEPQMRLWGVGYLPRAWQGRYVAWRRPDVHPYRLQLPSGRELERWCRDARWPRIALAPGLLVAPHIGGVSLHEVLRLYNSVRSWPVVRTLLLAIGPKLSVVTSTDARGASREAAAAADS